MVDHEYKRYFLRLTEQYVKRSLPTLTHQILDSLPEGVAGFQYGNVQHKILTKRRSGASHILFEDDLKHIPELEHYIFIVQTWDKVAPALRRWLNQTRQLSDLVGWFPYEINRLEGLEGTMEASRIKEITDSEAYGLLTALVYRQVLIPS